MLKKFRLIDFKSFADASVEVAPLTLLVGANAAGKSNFFDALRFLQATIGDVTFDDILNGELLHDGRGGGLRGGAAEAARIGKTAFSIESTWEQAVNDDELDIGVVTVQHRVTCQTRPEVRLLAERLAKGTGEELLQTETLEDGGLCLPWPPVPRRFGPGGHRVPSASASASHTRINVEQSVLWTILGSINPGSPHIPEEVAIYAQALSESFNRLDFLELHPEQMRGYGRLDAIRHTHDNLSGELYRLCHDRSAQKRMLVEWLAELCAPEIIDIDFILVEELGDVMAVLIEKGGRRISARSLSDGTLRFLGMVVRLLNAEPNSIFLIEEIAEGLHPARIRVLMEWLQSAHRELNIQIIATTHSPTVLQWLPEDSLCNVVLFARSPESEGTIARRLGDLPDFQKVVHEFGIDGMFTSDWLELAL